MDLFKAQLERISRQLSGLSASQKMLTGTLVIIMVMTLIWWGRYAAEPEMEPLLNHSISPEQMTAIDAALRNANINHSSSGDSILVAPADKLHAYSVLAFNKALRIDKDEFQDIIKNTNPFQSESMSDKVWDRARDRTLGQLISEFPDVTDAHVMVSAAQAPRIGHNTEPTASITIQTQPGVKEAPLVEAAATLVQGAQTGLEKSKIKVVINGHSVRLHDDTGEESVVDLRTAAHDEELKIEDKIRSHFLYLTGLLVNVTVAINNQHIDKHTTAYDPKTTLSKETDVRTSTDETTNPAASPGEAGAIPNTALTTGPAPAAASAGGGTHEESETKYQNFAGMTETHTQSAPGETTVVGAAVQLPYDALVASYKRLMADSTDSKKQTLQEYIADQVIRVRKQVVISTSLKDEAVAVDWYVDPTPVVAPIAASASLLSPSFIGANHIKEVILGALALVSLFMVSTLVKKGSTPLAPPASSLGRASAEPGVINEVETPVGEVGTADPSLDGLEMDPEAIRTHQVAQQVTSLVKENPDSAAALVKRWLNRA